jgi:thiamine-phosphate pyrophosphorylase
MMRVQPKLIAITDSSLATTEVWVERLSALAAMATPGSLMLQLRDRELPLRVRANFGRKLRALCAASEQLFAVNDRIDLALALGADGLHLGEASVSTADARRFAPALWISRAFHDPTGAVDADAVLLSPIFAPRKGAQPLGVEAIARARRVDESAGKQLLYALGGISAENARACLEAGADGVAAIFAVLAPDPRPLLEALGIARH